MRTVPEAAVRFGSSFAAQGRPRVGGHVEDADGGDGTVMLHVDLNGFYAYARDYQIRFHPIINPPSAGDLLFLLPEDRGQKPER